MKPTLIIDADDTLWEAEIYYEQCIDDFAALMASLGFDREEAVRAVDEVERERVPVVGYGQIEFARSLVITYERLCQRYGRPVVDDASEAVREIGRAVLEPPVVLLDGVVEALPQLGRRFRLLLLTKGDRAVQEDRLARSGLGHLFDGVHVVQEKDAGVIRALMAEYGLRPEQTWMVGNSPRSDINPALEAGIGAVYVPHACTWTFERQAIADPEQVIELGSFGELVALFFDGEA